MNGVAAGAWAIVVRDAKLFVSYRLRLVGALLTAVFSLTLFYYLSRLVGVRAFRSPDEYYAYAVVGLVILTVLNSTLGTPPGALRQELVAGTFERLCLSPLGAVASCIASLVFPFLYALGMGMTMLLFAALAFGLDLRWETLALAIPLSALGALAFLPFGILLLALTLTIKQAAAGTTWVVALIALVSGLYFPTTLLPGWIEWASEVQPFTPAVELLRNVIIGRELTDSVGVELAKLVGFAAVLLPPSFLVLRGALSRARRTGTITEY